MQKIEISITEVSELIGVSQNTLYKDFKKCVNKLEKHNISYEGKGKNRKFYIIEQDILNQNKEAYDIFKQIVYNVWKFNRQVDIDKLLHFMIVILKNQGIMDHTSILTHDEIADIIGLQQRQTISKYKKRFVENGVIQKKELSKFTTYCTKLKCELPTLTSILIPNENNLIKDTLDEDNFQYSYKIVAGEPIKQQYEEKCYLPCKCMGDSDTDLFKSYIRACGIVANTKYIRNENELEEILEMHEKGEKELKINSIHRCIAFQDFKKDLGIDKLWQICKTEYSPSFMKDIVLLDMIVRAFKYKFDNLYENEIDKYLLNYVNINIKDNNIHIEKLA